MPGAGRSFTAFSHLPGYGNAVMTIGILGSDERALAVGKLLRRGGNQVTFSDPRGAVYARRAAEAIGEGSIPLTAYAQAARSDMLLLAVPWRDVRQTLSSMGCYKEGILIDATRGPDAPGGKSGAELIARILDNRHVVKALIEPPVGSRPMKICANDPEARQAVRSLIEASGVHVEDLGPLSRAADIERECREEARAHGLLAG
jgi:predicted dinucleotide-binding enzyme